MVLELRIDPITQEEIDDIIARRTKLNADELTYLLKMNSDAFFWNREWKRGLAQLRQTIAQRTSATPETVPERPAKPNMTYATDESSQNQEEIEDLGSLDAKPQPKQKIIRRGDY